MVDGTPCEGFPDPAATAQGLLRDAPDRAWPDPGRAERLLDGAPADPADPREERFTALLRLLEAAGRKDEIDPARERAALAAFRAARRGRGPGRARRARGPVRPARALAGGLVAVFTLGAVAVAAGVGALPAPFRGGAVHAGPLPTQPHPAGALPVPLTTTPSRAARTPAGITSTATTPDADTDPDTAAPPPAGRERHALRAMCRRYEKAAGPGRPADRHAGARLERAAGGAERVGAYCRRLLAGKPGKPGKTGKPAGNPAAGPGATGRGGKGPGTGARGGKPPGGKPGLSREEDSGTAGPGGKERAGTRHRAAPAMPPSP